MSTANNCGWCQQGHVTKKSSKKVMKKQLNKMAPSHQKPLNGQGMQRISRYNFKNKKNTQIGIRYETWNFGSLCGRGTEVTEELRQRKLNICALQEV